MGFCMDCPNGAYKWVGIKIMVRSCVPYRKLVVNMGFLATPLNPYVMPRTKTIRQMIPTGPPNLPQHMLRPQTCT